MRWRQILEVNRARLAGAPLGDIAALKFAMIADPPPELRARLREQRATCLDVDLDALRALPEGSVGRAYARHLDDCGLSPLVISPELRRRLADDPHALRYTTTHDLFHVLTGFSTTPAGELGLFAFMIGQGFARRRLLWLGAAVYTLLLPLHARGLWRNLRVGLRLASRARNLLAEPLEPLLARPLAEVRRELGLPIAPADAGIAPGHPSLLLRWFIPKPAPAPAAAS